MTTMARDIFRFKQFDIYHDKCAMKVGTDGVLLGSWCNVEGAGSILDIGTGSGLIALMIAQRNTGCVIDAVEIDSTSCIQAEENVSRSSWKSRINVHHKSLQEYSVQTSKTYDLIVANPPYFQNSLPSPRPDRSTARHAGSLTSNELITGVKKLLNPGGRFCMIMPVTEANIFIGKASESNLFCRRVTSVLPNHGKAPKRYLLEFTPKKEEILRSELVIELDRRHKYSDAFKELTKDFYLYFRY